MISLRSNSWAKPAIQVAAAGFGAAVAGPLGGALGGWLGAALGGSAAYLIEKYAEKFGDSAAEKLLDVGADSLAEKLKESAPDLTNIYRDALNQSLAEVHGEVTGNFDDWFDNWDACLTVSKPLDLPPTLPDQLVPEKLDALFFHTLGRLDAQGAAIRGRSLSIKLEYRALPGALLSELNNRLPQRLEKNIHANLVKPEYEEGWKQAQLIFQNYVDSALGRIDETTQKIDLKTDRIAEDVATVRKIAETEQRTLRAPLRHGFDPTIKRLVKVFAGRKAELAKIAEFVNDGRGGYLIVTSPAGFGKSALMASLITQTPKSFAYHFFTSDPEHLNEHFFLRNVVEQLAEHFGEGGEPSTDMGSLNALFQRYMGSETSRPFVLLLDGLQEIRWDLRRYLRQVLPKGLSIILTVRETGQDWARDLDLSTATVQSIRIGALNVAEVREAFGTAGSAGAQVAANEQLIGNVMRITAYQGDEEQAYPPLVRWVLSDIVDGRLLPDSLRDRPSGFDPYLDELWKTLRGVAKNDAATGDFIGTLAAALGPMRQEELQIVNPSLVAGFAGDAFEQEILPSVRRFVLGNQERGYILAPAPFRDHVRERMAPTVQAYRDRLIAFCSNWRQNDCGYALEHCVAHLAECAQVERNRDALFKLVDDQDWYRGRSKRDPSYAAFIGDLHLAWSVAADADQEAIRTGCPVTFLGRELRWGLVKASLASALTSIRSRLLVALLKAELRSPSQALSIVIARIALLESQENKVYLPIARAIEGLAPFLQKGDLTRAAKVARGLPDQYAQCMAQIAIAQHLPPNLALGLIQEALQAGQSIEDAGLRVEALVRLVPSLPAAERHAVIAAAAEAARSADPEGRVESLLTVAKVADCDLRQELLLESRALLAGIDEPIERVETLCSLAPLLEADQANAALKEARAAVNLVDDPDEQVRLLSDLCGLMPPDTRESLIEETLNKARKRPNPESSKQIASLLGYLPDEQQKLLVRESMALADGVQPEADKARALLSIAENLPSAYRNLILADAEGIVRKIDDDAQRDKLLIEVALASDDAAQRRLLIEVGDRRQADLGIKNFEPDEREIVEVLALAASHLPPTEQDSLVSGALGIARSKGIREYDQARAFLALLPNLTLTEQVVLLEEIRSLARALKKPSEKGELLVALVPLVPRDQAESAQQEALAAARAGVPSGSEWSGRIDREDGIVTADRTSNLRRGQLLALLARCGLLEQRMSIAEEAVNSLEEMDAEGQAATVIELAPLLSEPLVSDLIERLHQVEADPLRLEIVVTALQRLAELESPEAARNKATDIWGENVPEAAAEVLSSDSQYPPPLLSAEVQDANTPVDGSAAEDASAASFTLSYKYPLTCLYRLAASPVNAICNVAFDSSQVEKGSAEETKLAESVARHVAGEDVSKLSPEDLRAVLDGLREFRRGQSWQHARTALVSRLAELGDSEKAYSVSRVFWPEGPPAQVLYSFWQSSVIKSQELLLEQTLSSALAIQDPNERARLLGRLLPHLPDKERAGIVSAIAAAADSVLTDLRLEQVDDELVQSFSSLPASTLLGVWHQAIRKLATFSRKDMLIALPPLLVLGSKLSQGRGFWTDAAAAIRAVRERWP